jgi:hypothetical protein
LWVWCEGWIRQANASTFAAGEKRAPRDGLEQNKLRKYFCKPVSFETIFYAALALHCGMHRGERETNCDTAGRIRKFCHDLSAIETDDRSDGLHPCAGLLSCVPSVA